MTDCPSGFLSDYLAYTGSYHYPQEWNLACGMALVGAATMARVQFYYRAWEVIPFIHPFLIEDSTSRPDGHPGRGQHGRHSPEAERRPAHHDSGRRGDLLSWPSGLAGWH